MSGELKPCPFCGSPATHVSTESTERIDCDLCGGSMVGVTGASVRVKWNARAPAPGEVTEAQKWIPVGERLPEHGAPIWFVYRGEVQSGRFSLAQAPHIMGNFTYWLESQGERPTHWMPLITPEPPAALIAALTPAKSSTQSR